LVLLLESSPELKQTIVEEVTWQRFAEIMQTNDLMTLKGAMMAVANLTAISTYQSFQMPPNQDPTLFFYTVDFHEELIDIGIVDQIIMCTKVSDVEITLSIAMALNNLAANRKSYRFSYFGKIVQQLPRGQSRSSNQTRLRQSVTKTVPDI
jgi:hypothetical protein